MKTGKVTESIWDGKKSIVALALVQHVERQWRGPYPGEDGLQPGGLVVVTSKTSYDHEVDNWRNAIGIPQNEADSFLSAWTRYRHELENESLMPCDELATGKEVSRG